MTDCASDMARHNRMLDLTGGTRRPRRTRTALDRIAGQKEPDLASALALACHRDHLAYRNAPIPTNLPAVWVTLGQLPRAMALASSITDLPRYEEALGQVAAVLAGMGRYRTGPMLIARSSTRAGRRAV